MTGITRVVPHPVLSAAILMLWAALAPAFGAGTLLVGAVVALAVPWMTRSFWPDRPRLRRPLAAAALAATVVADIIVANWQVARLVLGPLERLDPAFLRVPLDLEDPFVATRIGSIVSLTPGSVSVDIERERRCLLVHALHVDDERAMVQRIKTRYEAKLKEVFAC